MSIYYGKDKIAGTGEGSATSAYQSAVAGGYTGTEQEFNQILAKAIPNTRKVNGKSLENDIILTSEDVGAVSTGGGG